MKVKFSFQAGMDIECDLEIDCNKLSPDDAKAISEFWASSKDVLRKTNGDVHEAVARYAAAVFISEALDGNDVLHGNYNPFAEREGWFLADGVIECTDICIPEWSAEDLRRVDTQ